MVVHLPSQWLTLIARWRMKLQRTKQARLKCHVSYKNRFYSSLLMECFVPVDAWKHRFSSECLSIVHDQVFGARTPSYGTIMELDKRVLSYYVPPSLQVPGFGGSSVYSAGDSEPPMRLTMQRYIILSIKEVSEYNSRNRFGFVKVVFNPNAFGSSAIYASRLLRKGNARPSGGPAQR